MARGKLIAISGGEGSGKTSVIAALKGRHPEYCITREPGGTPVGEAIRGILLDQKDLDPAPLTELFLFFADRAEHLAKVVEPLLAQGKTVVTDRYWMDTYAYQWWTEMRQKNDRAFNAFVKNFGFREPDLWIWLDVDPKEGLTRRRGTGLFNRLDRKDLAFHTSVREGFRRLRATSTFPTVRIDSSKPLDAVVDAVDRVILQRLKRSS